MKESTLILHYVNVFYPCNKYTTHKEAIQSVMHQPSVPCCCSVNSALYPSSQPSFNTVPSSPMPTSLLVALSDTLQWARCSLLP